MKYKVVFLGDQSVGKTSIILRFTSDSFDVKYQVGDNSHEVHFIMLHFEISTLSNILDFHSFQATIGIDFLTKTVYVDDKMVRLQLWDTAGQERFRSLIPSYINDSQVAVVCYDITSRQSFESVKSWVEQARQIRGDAVTLIIVGNKLDLAEKRQVATEDGQALADELSTLFIETSAKVGINVKQLFTDLAKALPGVD